MTNIQIWYWWLLVLIQNIHLTYSQGKLHIFIKVFFIFSYCCLFLFTAQFMSFCNKTLNMSSSSLSIQYTPSSYSSCCNITLMPDLSEQIIINIFNLSTTTTTTTNSILKISNKQSELIKLQNSISSNRTYLKSDTVNLPIIFSLCLFNIPSFEILITTKGNITNNNER